MLATIIIIILILWNIVNTMMIIGTMSSVEKYVEIIDKKIAMNKEDIEISNNEIKDLYDKTKKDEDKLNRVIDLIIESEKEEIKSKGYYPEHTSTVLCSKLEDLRRQL